MANLGDSLRFKMSRPRTCGASTPCLGVPNFDVKLDSNTPMGEIDIIEVQPIFGSFPFYL